MKKIIQQIRFGVMLSAIACCLLPIANCSAASAQEEFTKANQLYQKQDYENAIKSYSQLIKDGNISAAVYFNLGNCYYKTGNTAKSILNYERGLKVEPDDEDINFNLKIAQLKVTDKIEPVPDIFYRRWLRSIALLMSANIWSWVYIACFWMMFAGAAVYAISSSAAAKKAGFAAIFFFLFLSCSAFVAARESHRITEVEQSAIITVPSVYVKSSPDEKGNDLFILHEGTKAELLDELGEWKKIRLANGSIGWLKATDVEII